MPSKVAWEPWIRRIQALLRSALLPQGVLVTTVGTTGLLGVVWGAVCV